MRILILTNYDVGLYKFRLELIQTLLKENEVYISLPYGELVEPLKEIGCEFIDTALDRRGVNPLTDIKLVLAYKKILKDVKPDMVITYTIKPNVYGGYVCGRKKIPYVVNVTGLGTAFQNDNLLKKFVTLLYKLGLKKARVIFFENTENKDVFVNEKIISEENTCVLNGAGVNLERYQPAEYPDGEKIKFLFMGRVMREKGIDELFEAMRAIANNGYNVQLDVLGISEENYQEKIEKYTAEGWLKFYGYQTDVKPFIEACHCFVLPSWHEGMANTNLECAAMARPVITSNIPGCREAVEDGKSGFLCEKQNTDSLYEAIRRFISLSYDDRKAMGICGRKRMEEVFDKKKVVEATIKRSLG